jgi:eukaryotic-like serine/threonine-protein kinase
MTGPAELFHQIEIIFQKAMEAPASQRTEMLERLCQGNAELLKEVQSLLKACEQEAKATAAFQFETSRVLKAWAERKRIGPYALERLIGHGGMSAVYLASRADGQFDQQVAIKLIDMPFVTALFQKRFRQERQILARLSHPNIARLLDGGVSDDGELYLVIEYVNGLSIQQYCNRHSLSTRERIKLFLSVCDGVRFAHQNLVVHRDLKPDNIIVLEDGTPKLLDFGTAKLLAPVDAAAETEFTRHGLRAFTPQYASPEQVLGHPISTATDIYSLGVLLFLLLTGMPPYELESSTTDEMIRVICREDPPKPSARSASGAGDSDLDAIVLKAMRKEPHERYGSVDLLIADLKAYMEGRPVAAHQGSFRYLAGKFIRRNKLILTASALLFLSVMAGMIGVIWQARIANSERRTAQARAEDLRKLSDRLLSDIDDAIQKLPGSTQAQKLLVSTVLEHLNRAAKDAAGDSQMGLDLANAYIRLGNVQGNPYDQNIGDTQGGLNSLDRAVAIATAVAKQEPQNAAAAHALGWAQQSRSEILFGNARTGEAIAMMRSAAAIYEELASRPGAKVADLFDAASAYGGLGDELGQGGTASLSDPQGAMAAFRKSLEIDERIVRGDPKSTRAWRGIAVNRMKIANIETETDPGSALNNYYEAIKGLKALPEDARKSLPIGRIEATIYRKTGMALKEIGRYQEAVSYMELARSIIAPFLAKDPNDMRAANDFLALVENEAECFEERTEGIFAEKNVDSAADAAAALRTLSEARSLAERLLRTQPGNTNSMATLGLILVRISLQQKRLRQFEAARDTAARGVSILKAAAKQPDAQGFDLDAAATGLSIVEPEQLRNPELAVECAERIVERSHHQKPGFLLTLAHAYRIAGQYEKSRSAAREGLALFPAMTSNTVPSRIRKELQAELAGAEGPAQR